MPLIKTVLIDDEPNSLKSLQLLLKKYCPDVELLASFNDAAKACKELPKLKPDLLFLDVQMPGINGFELLEQIQPFNPRVIFVTAHSEHAIKAIRFSALDYLLKPVDGAELKQAIEKFRMSNTIRFDHNIVNLLTRNIDFFSAGATTKIAVSLHEGIEIIQLKDVDYMKAERNYTMVKRLGHKDLLVSKTLKDFEETLLHSRFMRIHSSYLINLDKLLRYVRADGGYAIMTDGTKITVSRTYKDKFLQYLKA